MAAATRGRYPGIIRPFQVPPMEAEQINTISRRLSDVEGRAAELRRYL